MCACVRAYADALVLGPCTGEIRLRLLDATFVHSGGVDVFICLS